MGMTVPPRYVDGALQRQHARHRPSCRVAHRPTDGSGALPNGGAPGAAVGDGTPAVPARTGGSDPGMSNGNRAEGAVERVTWARGETQTLAGCKRSTPGGPPWPAPPPEAGPAAAARSPTSTASTASAWCASRCCWSTTRTPPRTWCRRRSPACTGTGASCATRPPRVGYLRTAVVNGSRSVLRRRRTARDYVPPHQVNARSAESLAMLLGRAPGGRRRARHAAAAPARGARAALLRRAVRGGDRRGHGDHPRHRQVDGEPRARRRAAGDGRPAREGLSHG